MRGWTRLCSRSRAAATCASITTASATPLHETQLEQLSRAIDNAMSIGFEAFVGQVVALLEPEHQADFRRRASWETLREQVVDTLRGLAS